MNHNNELVSIIVPAYCHEKYIEDCIQSILGQTYTNIELFITDDCSSDDTYNVACKWLDKLQAAFARVVICRNDVNRGVVKTLNSMIAQAKGKYIKIIASDDMLLPQCIEKLVDYYIQHQQADMIISNGVYMDELEHYPIKSTENHKKLYNLPPSLTGNVAQRIYDYNFVIAPTVMIKRDTYEKFGLFDESLSIEDWEYWIRVSLDGVIKYAEVESVAYRISNESLSHFTDNEAGRLRLVRMYDNQYAIIGKYKEDRRINYSSGASKFYSRMMSEAVDRDFRELQDRIMRDAKNDGVKLELQMRMKYVLYKIHILKFAQDIKRLLGMETAIKR